MKQTFYILTLLIFLTNCGNSQTTNSQENLTGNIQSDLKELLPNKNVQADIMDNVLQKNPRQVELTKKFQSA